MKQRHWGIVLLAGMLASTASISVSHAEVKGDVLIFGGYKSLDSDTWDAGGAELSGQIEGGVQLSIRGADWPVAIAADILASGDCTFAIVADICGSTSEIDLGVRKIWKIDKARPFVGGRPAFIHAELDVSSIIGNTSVSGNGTGFWVDGGVFWRLATHFELGLEARDSKAKVSPDVSGFSLPDVEAGAVHAGMILGWGC